MPPIHILAVCGSLQAQSGNLTLLRKAVARSDERVVVTLFEGIGALPLFNPDLEAAGEVPAAVARWREALARCDALLVASPEYGHSLPGALKNAIDWVIGSGELERKVVGITASTPAAERGRKGLAALRVPLGAVSARVVGGEPIVRGAGEDAALAALVDALAAEARRTPEE